MVGGLDTVAAAVDVISVDEMEDTVENNVSTATFKVTGVLHSSSSVNLAGQTIHRFCEVIRDQGYDDYFT